MLGESSVSWLAVGVNFPEGVKEIIALCKFPAESVSACTQSGKRVSGDWQRDGAYSLCETSLQELNEL